MKSRIGGARSAGGFPAGASGVVMIETESKETANRDTALADGLEAVGLGRRPGERRPTTRSLCFRTKCLRRPAAAGQTQRDGVNPERRGKPEKKRGSGALARRAAPVGLAWASQARSASRLGTWVGVKC